MVTTYIRMDGRKELSIDFFVCLSSHIPARSNNKEEYVIFGSTTNSKP